MHTLFAIPFTCSLSVHLALEALEAPFEIRWMKRFEHVLDDGAAYAGINPKRRVPALRLPDGELVTEMPVVMAYLDAARIERRPAEQRRVSEWLCYVATELHRTVLLPLYDPRAAEETRQEALGRYLGPVLDHLEARLSASPTLVGGEVPSVADHYLFWALLLLRNRWPERVASPALSGFYDRIAAQDASARVIERERTELRRQSPRPTEG